MEGVESEFEVGRVKCEASSLNFNLQSVECKVWSAACQVKIVGCEVRNVQCKEWSVKRVKRVKYEVPSAKCRV